MTISDSIIKRVASQANLGDPEKVVKIVKLFPELVEALRQCDKILKRIEKNTCRTGLSHYCPNCDNTIVGISLDEWERLSKPERK